MLYHKQSETLTGRSSYAVILLVSPLGSLTIAKLNGVSVHCFVVALFQLCTYTTSEYLVRILLHVDSLCKHYNFTENIAETSVHAQAVDTRPSLFSHTAWVRDYPIQCLL